MQRLAVFVGVLGAIAGGVASYFDLSDVTATRARHNAFEQLAASDVVQQQRKLLQTGPSPASAPLFDMSKATPISAPPLTPGAVVTPKSARSSEGWVISDSPIPPPPTGFIPSGTQVDPFAAIAKPVPSYQVNKGGIQTILWTKGYAVESIVTEDGQILHPEPAPSFWQYLLPTVFPVLGFFIPWGLVTAVVWVGAGFFEATK